MAVAPSSGQSPSQRSGQLDLFRGLAALFMVVNHAGYQLLGSAAFDGGPADWAVFIGSTAPALFFFATGVGSGLSAGSGDSLAGAARKVLLLVLADQFLNWGHGIELGLDFFGFAAISTAALYLLRKATHPVRLALALVVVILGLRFGLALVAADRVADGGWRSFVTGIGAVLHVSYPLCPWLAFPLLGFVVGRHWRSAATPPEAWAVGAAVVVCLAAGCGLSVRGAPVFRWGSVSLAYFLCAAGIVGTAWLAAGLASRVRPAAVDWLGLRGPASLLIVPLHYGLLGLLEAVARPPWGLPAWWPTVILLAIVVFGLSRALVAGARKLPVPGAAAQVGVAAAATGMALAALLEAPPLARLEICSAAEVAVAALLLWSTGSRRPQA